MELKLIQGRWLFNNRRFEELDPVERKLFAIHLKVNMICSKLQPTIK